jgi:hypothetical protein
MCHVRSPTFLDGQNGHAPVVVALLKAGADPTIVDKVGLSHLQRRFTKWCTCAQDGNSAAQVAANAHGVDHAATRAIADAMEIDPRDLEGTGAPAASTAPAAAAPSVGSAPAMAKSGSVRSRKSASSQPRSPPRGESVDSLRSSGSGEQHAHDWLVSTEMKAQRIADQHTRAAEAKPSERPVASQEVIALLRVSVRGL